MEYNGIVLSLALVRASPSAGKKAHLIHEALQHVLDALHALLARANALLQPPLRVLPVGRGRVPGGQAGGRAGGVCRACVVCVRVSNRLLSTGAARALPCAAGAVNVASAVARMRMRMRMRMRTARR